MIRLFTISLLLALCACADQQTELDDASRALRFGVEEIDETKGVVTTTQNIRSMSVFCAHTGKEQYSSTATCNWIHNAQVTRTDQNSEWTVQGIVNKQWKDDGYHSFFAFAPHAPEGAVVSKSSEAGPPTLTYTVPSDYTKQVDLLYSQNTLINGKQMYIGSRPVSFGFRHALSKITFDAKKEEVITDNVTITEIQLTSIINKAQYKFIMNTEYTNVEDINCITESAETITFSILPNKNIEVENTLLLPNDQALFMINQSFTNNNKLIITYNKGSEIGKTITANLSEVTPVGGWDISKAYRYSILIKEDKVTVTAQIQPWEDQVVDVAVPGTFLNVSNLSLSLEQGAAGYIYYSTDGSPISGTCDKNIILTHESNAKRFTFPASAAIGNYIATITAGKLSQKVKVKVDFRDYIAEEGVAAPRIFVQGTGDNAKLMLTKKPTNYGAYFQFMGITAWEYDNSIKYQPYKVTTDGSWTSSSAHNITSLKVGKGDPCRLVGYTQKQVQDMVRAGTLPDNKKWKTPETNSGVATDNRANWRVLDGINGHYLNTKTPQSDFLPAAGLSWRGGTNFENRGSMGFYWTQELPKLEQGSPLTVQPAGFNVNNEQHHSLRMSVRCVRQ